MAEANETPTNQGSGQGAQQEPKEGQQNTSLEARLDGLEKGFHESRQETSALKGSIDALVGALKQIGTGTAAAEPGFDYGRAPAGGGGPHPDTNAFLNDPVGYLEKREQQHTRNVVQAVGVILSNVNALNDWKRENPDLIKHEKLISQFMQETDANKPTYERLNEAGKKAKAYLAGIKADRVSAPRPRVDAESYVESPAGTVEGGNGAAQARAEEDQSTADYITERNKIRAEAFGVKMS